MLIIDHKTGPAPDPEARFATYWPQLAAYADALRLTYRSSAAGARLEVLLPPDRGVAGATLGGAPVTVTERRVGNDRYLALDEAPATGELKARLVPQTP